MTMCAVMRVCASLESIAQRGVCAMFAHESNPNTWPLHRRPASERALLLLLYLYCHLSSASPIKAQTLNILGRSDGK